MSVDLNYSNGTSQSTQKLYKVDCCSILSSRSNMKAGTM